MGHRNILIYFSLICFLHRASAPPPGPRSSSPVMDNGGLQFHYPSRDGGAGVFFPTSGRGLPTKSTGKATSPSSVDLTSKQRSEAESPRDKAEDNEFSRFARDFPDRRTRGEISSDVRQSPAPNQNFLDRVDTPLQRGSINADRFLAHQDDLAKPILSEGDRTEPLEHQNGHEEHPQDSSERDDTHTIRQEGGHSGDSSYSSEEEDENTWSGSSQENTWSGSSQENTWRGSSRLGDEIANAVANMQSNEGNSRALPNENSRQSVVTGDLPQPTTPRWMINESP